MIPYNERERRIQKQLKKEVELPEVVARKAQEAYRKIENHEVIQERGRVSRGKWHRTTFRLAGGAAAALAVAFLFCLANPVMAEDLPVMGAIFERLQNQVSFFGNFSDRATSLEETDPEEIHGGDTGDVVVDGENQETASSEKAYSRTQDGLTVTISEVYANDQAIYLTMAAESEKPFPATQMMENEESSRNGKPLITAYICSALSFMDETADENFAIYNLEGEFLDDHTYACILRLDLAEEARDYSEYNEQYDAMVAQVEDEIGASVEEMDDDTEEGYALLEEFNEKVMARAGALRSYIRDIPVPEEFSLQLDIQEIIGTRADSGEKYSYQGNWDFEIPVTVDNSQTVVMEINETNQDGIGLESVIKTPYEITVNELYDEGGNSDAFLVALDANGNKLPYNESNGNTNNFAIQDRDISTVDIYILDYVQYMDELKGPENYNNNENKPEGEKWSDLLAANAKYHKTVHFE